MSYEIVLGLALVLVFGIGAQWISWRLRLPSILLLLILGFAAGQAGLVKPGEMLGDLLFPLVSICVAIILFEGGLSLQFKELKRIGGVVRNILTIGVLITWVLTALLAYYVLGLSLGISVLLGAILVVTGPTVIGPLLRHIRPTGRTAPLLKWEGIVIDPIGAMLAVLVFEVVQFMDNPDIPLTMVFWKGGWIVVKALVAGGLSGSIAAYALMFVLRRQWVPDFLENPITLMVLVASYTGAEYFQKEAGLLATTVMGIIIANQTRVEIRHIVEFKENLRTLIISGLFILLAARIEWRSLAEFNIDIVWFLLGIFLIRPIAVFASSIASGLSWQQKAFLSWMAPRGIVAAAVSSIFSLQPGLRDDPNAPMLVSVTFAVIIATVAVYGLTAGPLARLLGLAGSEPQGLLIVGAHQWARQLANLLARSGARVMLVDTNVYNVSVARGMGLTVVEGNVLDEHLTNRMDFEGIGRLIAITPNDEVNALACIRFANLFGRANVYQLSPHSSQTNEEQSGVTRELRGRVLFARDLNFATLSRLFREGSAVRTDVLTREMDFGALQSQMGGDRYVPLFAIGPENRIQVSEVDLRMEPRVGQTLVGVQLPAAEKKKESAHQVTSPG